jgi:DegV family protein with EDD domain
MRGVAVVTDSSANIPDHLARELGIHIVPLSLTFDRQVFRDGVDITPAEVYRLQRTEKSIPTTSAPSIGDFLRIYAAAGCESTDVVSIHMSRRLSATHEAALVASGLLDGVRVHVVDCHTAAMGAGFAVIEAARAAQAGASVEVVIARVEEVASRMHLLFTIDTLEYLRRGGRVGVAAVLLATALQIKPVLYLADGHVEPIAKLRTKARAVSFLVDEMERRVGSRPLHVAVFHADVPGEAEKLRQTIAERFQCVELYLTTLTPVMGAHTGPGVLGTAFYAD